VGTRFEYRRASPVRKHPAQKFGVESHTPFLSERAGLLEQFATEEPAGEFACADQRITALAAPNAPGGVFERHHAAGANAAQTGERARRRTTPAVGQTGEPRREQIALRGRGG